MLSKILKKYFDENGITVPIFAMQCKLTEQAIRGMLKDKHKIRRETARLIVKATRSKITYDMLSPYIFVKDW